MLDQAVRTALFASIRAPHMVRSLADVGMVEEDTALHVAVRARLMDAVQVLLPVSPWAALNAAGRTAVEEALMVDDDVAALMRVERDKALRDGAKTNPERYWACIRVRQNHDI